MTWPPFSLDSEILGMGPPDRLLFLVMGSSRFPCMLLAPLSKVVREAPHSVERFGHLCFPRGRHNALASRESGKLLSGLGLFLLHSFSG